VDKREGKEQGAGKNDSIKKSFFNQRGWGVRGM
jgi:hypothetical protein